MLPIVFEGTVGFLKSDYFKGGLVTANPVMIYNANAIPDLLAGLRMSVFGKKTVQQYNLRSFFFQLNSINITYFEWKNNKKQAICVLNSNFKDDMKLWNGYEFRRLQEWW